MRRLALISVADKSGVVDLAIELQTAGYEIVSTGGTAAALMDAGVLVTQIEQLTRMAEIFGGSVKTAHPAVHGAILAQRDSPEHMQTLHQYGMSPIDVVVVNLYPFAQLIANQDATFEHCVAQIDTSGAALIRAAAKNHRDVVVSVDPTDYPALVEQLHNGWLDDDQRTLWAYKAFAHTANYDRVVANWLAQEVGIPTQPSEGAVGLSVVAAAAPAAAVAAEGELVLTLQGAEALRYGENPHQAAWRYDDRDEILVDRADFVLHQGKALSYNNWMDADLAWAIIGEFAADKPAAAVIKHANPCGLGVIATSAAGALMRALDADPISALNGVLALNRPFDVSAARALGNRVLEAIIAPDFVEEALEILAENPDMRLISLRKPHSDRLRFEIKSTAFGVLVQSPDAAQVSLEGALVVTQVQPTPAQWQALDLAWRVCKYVKSNGIVIADEFGTIGIGAGQMSRNDAAVIAIGKQRKGHKTPVAASDGFFPTPDGLETLVRGGVRAVVQPGGSKRDTDVIAAANAAKIAMVFTGQRHLRH